MLNSNTISEERVLLENEVYKILHVELVPDKVFSNNNMTSTISWTQAAGFII